MPTSTWSAGEHHRRLDLGAPDDAALAIFARPASSPPSRTICDRRMIGLSAAWRWICGQHHVGLGLGEEAAALDRRQLRGIAEHQHRLAEREQVAAEFLVDHRAFVDDDQAGARRRTVLVEREGRRPVGALARAVDQRVDGGRAARSPWSAAPAPPCR